MPKEPIPFVPNQGAGAALAGASPIAMNVVLDAAGAVRRRPCITTHAECPATAFATTAINGLYVTAANEILALSEADPYAKVYRLKGGASINLSPTTAASVTGQRRPVFAETEAIVAIAAGDRISKVVLDGFAVSALGGDPPKATHVVANASRLLANNVVPADNLNFIYYSAFAAGTSYAGHEDWTGFESGTISADSRPEPVTALHENMSEVVAFGTGNLETFAPDGTLDYARSLVQEYGCIAPYSVIKVGKGFAWMDNNRRLVVSDGRSTQILSSPIQQTLDDMTEVTDAFGYRVQLGAVDAMVWTFPADGRTFVFGGGGWSQWASSDAGTPAPMPITAHALRLGTNLVGTSSGRVGRLSAAATDDLGEAVPCYIETGFVDRGSSSNKQCRSVSLTLKRGSADEGEVQVSWRDDDGPWRQPLHVPLGPDRETVALLRSLGTYRTRQWRLSFSGSEALTMVSVVEDYEVLGA